MRMQWVSVTTAGLPYTSPISRFAVFLPIPGRVSRSSMVWGSSPPYTSRFRWHMPMMLWALVW